MNGIQYQYYQNGENCFSEQTCITENAGVVIINVGGIDINSKPYGAV